MRLVSYIYSLFSQVRNVLYKHNFIKVKKFSVPTASGLNFERQAYFGEKFGVMTSPVIGRGELAGKPNRGPLIIEEFEGTTVVPPDAFVHRDGADNIIIELEY